MSKFEAANSVLLDAVRAGAFAAAVVEVGGCKRYLWRHAFGSLSHEPGALAATPETVFDLASLTKVLATTTLAMTAVDEGRVELDAPISRWLADWRGADRESVTVRDLLAHSSGLTAHLPYFLDHRGRSEFEHSICTMPLEYAPRSRSVYSDLGFILLGFILEVSDVNGLALDAQFDALVERRKWGELRYRPPVSWRARTAPTEIDPWRGRLLVGEVHDGNAWALGGVAGHSGLFGTAMAVGAFARDVLWAYGGANLLAKPATFEIFTSRTSVAGTSRALGWDTMVPTSSCGRHMSATSIGHTGFTGTSLWIDSRAEAYILLLTNRVYPSRSNDAILEVRPALHDAVMEEFESDKAG